MEKRELLSVCDFEDSLLSFVNQDVIQEDERLSNKSFSKLVIDLYNVYKEDSANPTLIRYMAYVMNTACPLYVLSRIDKEMIYRRLNLEFKNGENMTAKILNIVYKYRNSIKWF